MAESAFGDVEGGEAVFLGMAEGGKKGGFGAWESK